MSESPKEINPGKKPSTYFAPAERAGDDEFAQTLSIVESNPIFQVLVESIDGFLMILNEQRQVLAVNKELLDMLCLDDQSCALGNRPGEILNCIHSKDGPGGCGTSQNCETCGAVITILASQEKNEPCDGECFVTVKKNEDEISAEFKVRATPVKAGAYTFTILIFNDISGEKRRQALERTFFHDVLNTLTGLMGLSSMLSEFEGLDPKATANRILALSRKLSREIEDQRRLTQAENGTLAPNVETVSVKEILDMIEPNFEANKVAVGKDLIIDPVPSEETITTDTSLLGRILTNMTKNAFEAIFEGEEVRISYKIEDGKPTFFVSNPGEIPKNVALQIFKRSFSTKAAKGRGIGTYSMKLFGEKYLGGEVGFTTGEDTTTFYIRLPKDGPPAQEN